MDRTTIERLVDGIDSALGPTAETAAVEELAVEMLSGFRLRKEAVFPATVRSSPVQPESVTVHVRLSDCASRLSPTVVAHGYDKLRRLTTTIPAECRDYFQTAGLAVPRIELRVHSLDDLLVGFSPSEMIEILTRVECAGIDADFDKVGLLSVRAGKNSSAATLTPVLADLVNACTHSELEVEIGSKRSGVRAQDLLETARVILAQDPETRIDSLLTVSCNTHNDGDPFRSQKGDLRIDLSVSVWPRLALVQNQLSIGACYTDRYELLGQTGSSLVSDGRQMLANMLSAIPDLKKDDVFGSTFLSIDAPGEGPSPAGIWAGFPTNVSSVGGASRAAALLLKNGLLSGLPADGRVQILSDGLPLSNTLRNVRCVSRQMPAAELAGYLVEEFADAVVSGSRKSIKFLVQDGDGSAQRVFAGQAEGAIPGTVEWIARRSGWTDDHFSRGGAVVPPTPDQAA